MFFIAGCENLEDTYSEYAGDGKIQYVGKCTDVVVSPGGSVYTWCGKIAWIPISKKSR